MSRYVGVARWPVEIAPSTETAPVYVVLVSKESGIERNEFYRPLCFVLWWIRDTFSSNAGWTEASLRSCVRRRDLRYPSPHTGLSYTSHARKNGSPIGVNLPCRNCKDAYTIPTSGEPNRSLCTRHRPHHSAAAALQKSQPLH